MDQFASILGLIISLISVTTFIGGILAYQRSSARKEYAAERDFNHLKNSIAQQSKNMEELWRQQDMRFDHTDQRLTEIKMAIDNVGFRGPRPGHQVGSDPG